MSTAAERRKSLVEEFRAMTSMMSEVIERLRSQRGDVLLRFRTTEDFPPRVVVKVPVRSPVEAMMLWDDFDLWLVNHANPASNRIIIDSYYER